MSSPHISEENLIHSEFILLPSKTDGIYLDTCLHTVIEVSPLLSTSFSFVISLNPTPHPPTTAGQFLATVWTNQLQLFSEYQFIEC